MIVRTVGESWFRFQPTPSARRVTGMASRLTRRGTISTHTLRKEGDGWKKWYLAALIDFNPHPPQGG